VGGNKIDFGFDFYYFDFENHEREQEETSAAVDDGRSGRRWAGDRS
jgi:hypothetical protein